MIYKLYYIRSDLHHHRVRHGLSRGHHTLVSAEVQKPKLLPDQRLYQLLLPVCQRPAGHHLQEREDVEVRQEPDQEQRSFDFYSQYFV